MTKEPIRIAGAKFIDEIKFKGEPKFAKIGDYILMVSSEDRPIIINKDGKFVDLNVTKERNEKWIAI